MQRRMFFIRSIAATRVEYCAWLLLACLLSGCGAGISEEQKAAMQHLRDVGAKVNYSNGGYEVDFTGTQVEDADLAYLKHIPHVRNVNLQGTRVSDAGMEHLLVIETLEFLYLQRSTVSRAKADELKKRLKAEVVY